MEILDDLERLRPAFTKIASKEQKIYYYLLKQEIAGCIVSNPVIRHDFPRKKDKIIPLINILIKKKKIEKFYHCPFCKKDYSHYYCIPLKCDKCQKRIVPKELRFKSKHQWPKFFIKLTKIQKQNLEGFIDFNIVFKNFIKK